MVVKTELCVFSGKKLYPGHGVRYVPTTSVIATRPIFTFFNQKNLNLFLKRRNPRGIRWTISYRKEHKKGQEEKKAKTRRHKKVKVQRAIAGTSLEFIKAQQAQTEEMRKKIREQAKKEEEARKKKFEQKAKAKAEKVAPKPAFVQQQVPKVQQKAPQRKSGTQSHR